MGKIQNFKKKTKEFNLTKTLISLFFVFVGVFMFITACKKEIEKPGPDPETKLEDAIHKFDPNAENVTIQWLGETISCQKINGKFIFQGDIIVVPDEGGTKAAELKGVRLWDEGKIYYSIDDNFRFRDDLSAAIKHISSYTNIKFIELTTPEALDYRKKSYINFITEEGKCWSHLGMLSSFEIWLNGGQNLSIGWSEVGAVIHELGHALGLIHEHSRSDRDDHIKIEKNNIDEKYKIMFNLLWNDWVNNNIFKKHKMGEYSSFDYGSLMIYAPNCVGKPIFNEEGEVIGREEVLKKKDGTSYIKEYQREKFSANDIEVINRMYPKITVSPDIIISNEASEFISDDIYRVAGEVIYAGDPGITERGFYYGKNNALTTKVVATGNTTGLYSCHLIDLEPKTNYTAKAYVIQNGKEIRSENSITFLTDDGLTGDIHDLLPEEYIEILKWLGLEIHGGKNPPFIEGTYLGSPMKHVKSNFFEWGTYSYDTELKFYNQDNSKLTILIDGRDFNKQGFVDNSEGSWVGTGAFIVGNDPVFSIFAKEVYHDIYGHTVEGVSVYSGELVTGGIKNLQTAYIMVDDHGDPMNIYIENGHARLSKDWDGFSEKISSKSKSSYSSKTVGPPARFTMSLKTK